MLACVVGCLAAALHGLWLLAGWVAATGELRSWGGGMSAVPECFRGAAPDMQLAVHAARPT